MSWAVSEYHQDLKKEQLQPSWHSKGSAHLVDQQGQSAAAWFHRRKRVTPPGGGELMGNNSKRIAEVLTCPPPASARSRLHGLDTDIRQVRQLCQAAAPSDFTLFSTARGQVAPKTPERPGSLARTLDFQGQLRDTAPRSTPRVLDKALWTPRRGEMRIDLRPPLEQEMLSSADQLRAVPSAARTGVLRIPEADGRVRHSSQRLECLSAREISAWPFTANKLAREDRFNQPPMRQTEHCGAKFDIITNARREFWY